MHNLHGNILVTPGTYGFEKTFYEPDTLVDQHKQQVYMLILISSSPHSDKNTKLRAAIRKSWGDCADTNRYKQYLSDIHLKNKNLTCKLIFYMGKSLSDERNQLNKEELERYNDIIIGDFTDSYHNMTRKLLFAFNWAAQKYSPDYVLKTDDDIYMNVPMLIRKLNTKYRTVRNLYGGHIYYASVVRDQNHRHYLTREEYPNDWYPPYNKGGELIVSGHLLKKMLQMSTQIKRFQIDDAYIGLLMNHINVLPVKISEFVLSQWLTYFIYWLSTCDLQSMVGIGDNLVPSQFDYIHKTIHDDASWYCFRSRNFILYVCLLFLIILFVLVFMKKRYCPWLTPGILLRSFKIFTKRAH